VIILLDILPVIQAITFIGTEKKKQKKQKSIKLTQKPKLQHLHMPAHKQNGN